MPTNGQSNRFGRSQSAKNSGLEKLLQRGEGLANLGGLVEGAQAATAYLDSEGGAVAVEGLLVDIGLEASLGVPVGVAHIVAAHTGLQAYLAAHNGCLSALGCWST